jgi:hypothetical protein
MRSVRCARPLTDDEGGGYLIEFPDIPGCISDGETHEEAIVNGLPRRGIGVQLRTD